MIEDKDLIEIGKFQRPHGLRGEINMIADVDDDVIANLLFTIVKVEGIPTPFEIEEYRPKGRSTILVKFRGVDDTESLRALVNKPAYALRSALPDDYASEGSYAADIVGFRFEDTEGRITGTVEGIDLQTANALLIINGDDGNNYLIPLADDLVEIFNPDERLIVMDLPEGLIDI